MLAGRRACLHACWAFWYLPLNILSTSARDFPAPTLPNVNTDFSASCCSSHVISGVKYVF